MATGMREKTTNVGGVIKRIWYAMTGTTQGPELASLDDTGKFKCVSEQVSSLAGTGTRIVVADSTGNLSTEVNRFQNIYVEGSTSSVANNTWVTICDCPIGSTDIAVVVGAASFETTPLYYSQAGFARGSGGVAVAIYIANSDTTYGTQIRLNGNSIEAKQLSGAPNIVRYRYTTKNTRN